jgi:hypothetical protein
VSLLGEASVYELPSEPFTTSCVAYIAVTVNVDEFPAVMEVGLAEMLTVGAGLLVTVTVVLAVAVPPDPLAVAV